jgi:hypothetical protein
MDDFLYNLRSGKDKRFDRSRRSPEGLMKRPGDRPNSMDRRKKRPFKTTDYSGADKSQAPNLLGEIRTLLAEIAATQKTTLAAFEKQAEREERTISALERIASALTGLSGDKPTPSISMV